MVWLLSECRFNGLVKDEYEDGDRDLCGGFEVCESVPLMKVGNNGDGKFGEENVRVEDAEGVKPVRDGDFGYEGSGEGKRL